MPGILVTPRSLIDKIPARPSEPDRFRIRRGTLTSGNVRRTIEASGESPAA